ncbi:unnamed protein product [Candida verbasci]|uniref:Uncharacterized protein n=1 Tax=Candida verbasci TaxID=1227364 RepID=A0A9W4U0N4_9ASCO|nr:unnamed protein product [Candida verbasci]
MSLNQFYHDLKFKFDIHRIESRLKHYSLNDNPRIIKEKQQDQSLISLRTYPKEKYKDSSNFLKNSSTLQQDYLLLEEVTRTIRDQEIIRDQTRDLNEENLFSTFQIDLNVEISNDENVNDQDEEDEKPKNKLYDFFVSNMNKLKGGTTEKETTPLVEEKVQEPPVKEPPQIWKMVLNDVSLSAARLSTGSSSIPIINNTNIRGDFTRNNTPTSNEINNENDDIFAINLQQAKNKYYK